MKFLHYFERPYKCWLPRNMKRKVTKIDSIEIDIVSHCNLNCKSCSHFSPIAEKWFIEPEKFEKDLVRTNQILPDSTVGKILILGGEPLLHPQINKILVIARNTYKETPIAIITNGFLLPNMDEMFWKTCKEQKIEIEITKYPVKYDYEKLESIIRQRRKELHISYKGRTKILKKKQYMLPLDLHGTQDALDSFRYCFMGGHCINLSEGHLYTCSYAAFIKRFNSFFNQSIPVCAEDGVDIYQDQKTDEMIRKLTSPIPLCQYCAVQKRTYGNKWETSKKDISEWT